MPTTAERFAVYHILQLAEQGRFEFIIAQMIASCLVSSDESNADEFFKMLNKIEDKTLDLMLDPSEIWEGLLPGPGGQHCDELTTISMDEFGELDQARRNVKEIIDIVGEDVGDDELRMDNLTAYFLKEGLITERKPEPLPMEDDDQFEYRMSIIIAPGIKHGDTSDLLIFNQVYHVESPLNLADEAIRLMERRTNNFPEEEQAAWISKSGTEHWIMTWDQAVAIVTLDAAKDKLDSLAGDFPMDWDDMFQAIADQMAIQGTEYVNRELSRIG